MPMLGFNSVAVCKNLWIGAHLRRAADGFKYQGRLASEVARPLNRRSARESLFQYYAQFGAICPASLKVVESRI
jgi:hypothetical protein